MQVKAGKSPAFTTSKGLFQGCLMSPALFKIYIEMRLQTWTRKCQKIGNQDNRWHVPTFVVFAIDQVTITQDGEDVVES